MAESSFEQKVQGLQNYYRDLQGLDPVDPGHIEAADPDFFFFDEGHSTSQPLQTIMQSVVHDLECHGRKEYDVRDLRAKDLREDTDELRAERADVLAVMTAPLSDEVREQRAERIATVLGDIASGRPFSLDDYGGGLRAGVHYRKSAKIAIDLNRAVFGMFIIANVYSRVLTVQYDTPVYFYPPDEEGLPEAVVHLDVPMLAGSRNTPAQY